MTAATAEHPLPAVEALKAENLDGVMALVQAVRWPHRRQDVGMLMRLGRGRVVRSPDGDSLLGAGLSWRFGDALARIGLVIVSPEAQGRGLGRRLVEQLLADAADRPVMLLATEAGKPLYDSLGFVSVGACRQHQGTFAGEPASDPRIRAGSARDLDALVAFDAAAFGTRRDLVLATLMSEGRTAILEQEGRIAGYAIERAFGRGSVVGPIVATNGDDAILLFRALARPGFVRVDCPVAAEALGRHLVDSGLTPVGADSPVMVRGTAPEPAGPQQIYALTSHALG